SGRPGAGGRPAPLCIPDRGGVSALGLAAPVEAIDARLASRSTRSKGEPARAVLADGLGIRTVGQLLRHYPRDYIDRTETRPIREIRVGQEVTVIGRVKEVEKRRIRNQRHPMVIVTLYDGTGYLHLSFFN